jgi:hypothetical protein
MDANGWVKNFLKIFRWVQILQIKVMVQEVGRLIHFLGTYEHHKQ